MNEYHQVKESMGSLRPYEKCLKFGPGFLSDAELLGVILRTGAVGMDAVALGERILKMVPSCSGLAGMYRLSVDELC